MTMPRFTAGAGLAAPKHSYRTRGTRTPSRPAPVIIPQSWVGYAGSACHNHVLAEVWMHVSSDNTIEGIEMVDVGSC
jgi:hypothetical protein